MSKTAGVALAVVAVLAGLAIGAIPAQSQPGNRTTITALDLNRDDRTMEIDNNSQGPSKGDVFGFTSPLLDPEDRSKIGAMRAMCTALTFSKETQRSVQFCEAEAEFEGGKLTVEGSLVFARNVDGATFTITGGTGQYEGAAGTGTLEFARNSATITFDFVTNA